MSAQMTTVRVIVPLAANEDTWRTLLPLLPESLETWLAAATPPPNDWQELPNRRWLHCPQSGRGAQMNAAAAVCGGNFLWFVHADTQLSTTTISALQHSLTTQPAALHYFSLRFYDGGWRMRINEWGVLLRCRLFKNPFGDQALCVPRSLFERLGGFPTEAVGEDHLFVLRSGRAGTHIARVNATVGTSARTYMRHGWWYTVISYQRIWWKQWQQK
ncbi:hypothetical protein NQX30_05955 [Candidatus Persebacteraceae bacterium Df01]|jgi:hypothetical protein|uniref:Glycosyltransferase 2-like domain-containing protein n=1 Tax=Candidatus Doriopsillibacter californiensis TaxID=2970740 RepID=A0ABT7QMU5_9GAMM|nr:hypothetical protein [Candidatus Persebacteraceae bacterium Df01]